jgi:DNA-3-methyladenine glycosylase
LSSDLGELLAGEVSAVAPRLIGCRLRTAFDGAVTVLLIAEVEAYGGGDDPASHAFRGGTPRNASMFESAGTLYVYRSYGIHWCANVVTGTAGDPAAVLIRGGVPTAGVDTMKARRGRSDRLAAGPGNVCAALGITGAHDGFSLAAGPVWLEVPSEPRGIDVEVGPRIGISRGVDRPWRFVARGLGRSSLAVT